MPKKDRDFWESKKLNDQTYQMYYNRLTEIAINMFEWKNLPATIDPRFLELTLFSDGMAIFFKEDSLNPHYFNPNADTNETYLALQCMIGGNLDVYRIPMIRQAYATNGYRNNDLTPKNSIIIFNNYMHTNCLLDIEMYARRLYEIERTIDVNIKQQKTPTIIRCSENQRLVLVNLFKNYEGNIPFIYGDKSLDLTGINTIPINSPFISDKLQILKRQIYNEALTYLGVENANTEKKERLVTDEISSNLGGVEAQRYTRLDSRRDACKAINTMFGLDISVDFRQDLMEQVSENIKKGDEIHE